MAGDCWENGTVQSAAKHNGAQRRKFWVNIGCWVPKPSRHRLSVAELLCCVFETSGETKPVTLHHFAENQNPHNH